MMESKEKRNTHRTSDDEDNDSGLPNKKIKLSPLPCNETDSEQASNISGNPGSAGFSADFRKEALNPSEINGNSESTGIEILDGAECENLSAKETELFNAKEINGFDAAENEILYAREDEKECETLSGEETEIFHVKDINNLDATENESLYTRVFEKITYKSSWSNKKVCVMLWKDTSYRPILAKEDNDHAAELAVERRPSLIGVQMLTSESDGSCLIFADQEFRSAEVKWELKTVESKRRNLNREIFKSETNVKGKTFTEMFPSSKDEAGQSSGNKPKEYNKTCLVTLEIKRTTYREATIEWSMIDPSPCPAEVDNWLVVIHNTGRKPSNDYDYWRQPSEVLVLLKSESPSATHRIDNDLEYQAGHFYIIQVVGLKTEQGHNNTVCYSVVAFAEESFRAENTEEDMNRLLTKARLIREHLDDTDDDHRVSHWLYRDKTSLYFQDLKTKHNNVMTVYIKDANGDPAAAIQRKIKGLFFTANVDFETGQPMEPPKFGNVRIKIPPKKILTEDTRMYLGDFYCLNKAHLVTLVVTRPGSEADEFCRQKKLPLLSRTDKTLNPFLFLNNDGSWSVSSRITVEVFYTEDIDMNKLTSVYNGRSESFRGWRDRRQGDKWKNQHCRKCNLYENPIEGALVV